MIAAFLAPFVLGQISEVRALDEFIARHPRVSAKVRIDHPNNLSLAGSFWMEGRQRLRLEAFSGAKGFRYITNEGGTLSIDFPEPVYIETPWQGETTSFAELPRGYWVILPSPYLAGSVEKAFSETAQYTSESPITLQGASRRRFHVVIRHPNFTESYHLAIGDDGRLIQLAIDRNSGQSSLTLSDYQTTTSGGRLFDLSVPNGYVPAMIPPPNLATAVGETVTNVELQDSRGARTTLYQTFRRQALVAFVDEDWLKGSAGAAFLQRAKQKAGVPLVLVSDDVNPPKDSRLYYDPSRTALRRIGIPGSPYFMLIDGNGKLLRAWMSYNPANDRLMWRELEKALKG